MDIARAAIDKPVNTWIIVLICLLGGIWGLLTVGRLEDPSFTIKQAVVLTEYPGATAEEVEEEVTERLESAIQQMPQLDRVTSKSMPGMSEIEVEIKMTYDGTQLPQIWDELRRKVGDAQRRLPNGAGPSVVNDDFGDVFGIFYAVTTPGFSAREKREIAKFLRREVLTVPDVAKVATDGEREEAIYIEVSNERLASLGISVDQILATIQSENAAEPAGATRVGEMRACAWPCAPASTRCRAIEALGVGRPGTTEQLSLVDIAEIKARARSRSPINWCASTACPAFTLAVSGVADSNIVAVGQAVEGASARHRGPSASGGGNPPDLRAAPGRGRSDQRFHRQSRHVGRHRDRGADAVHGLARGHGRGGDAAFDGAGHCLLHARVQYRDGADLARRADHRPWGCWSITPSSWRRACSSTCSAARRPARRRGRRPDAPRCRFWVRR